METVGSKQVRRSLSAEVAEALRDDISGGAYRIGDKLPTEPALIARFGVSRTVIREAIVTLRADGLVQSRHGVGVFVTQPHRAVPELQLLTQVNKKISDIIEELELRASVEIEAAGLAAERCAPAQEAEIQAQLDAFETLMRAGDPTAQADFEFHVAIARATNNARFEEFLAHLGRRTIPRSKLRDMAGTDNIENRDAQLHREHMAVAEAIYARDSQAAREAMRVHLGGSLRRYRVLTQRQNMLSGDKSS
ncbi:FadR family transcriptional regulator [Phyllobacterium phragmitis]|uniref:FadR family transcriptional regulator n=1 Tax=Phyllobacterium phragmitis TaxID=2670329 RepID=A0A2S9IPI9_9HYPH|nr:FadR/GntR family transcriptional regulator [Phyllobacterium phragmitis]PRD42425.1 FadR family transcriptional regulator [Phyllobacterium phragmitis]